MDKAPSFNKFIHPDNRKEVVKSSKSKLEVVCGTKGENELGNTNHIESLKGAPHGADVTGHDGKMHWGG